MFHIHLQPQIAFGGPGASGENALDSVEMQQTVRARTRSKTVKEYGFGACIGNANETSECNLLPCE